MQPLKRRSCLAGLWKHDAFEWLRSGSGLQEHATYDCRTFLGDDVFQQRKRFSGLSASTWFVGRSHAPTRRVLLEAVADLCCVARGSAPEHSSTLLLCNMCIKTINERPYTSKMEIGKRKRRILSVSLPSRRIKKVIGWRRREPPPRRRGATPWGRPSSESREDSCHPVKERSDGVWLKRCVWRMYWIWCCAVYVWLVTGLLWRPEVTLSYHVFDSTRLVSWGIVQGIRGRLEANVALNFISSW